MKRETTEKGMIEEVFHLRDFSNWLLNRGEGGEGAGLKMKIDSGLARLCAPLRTRERKMRASSAELIQGD